MTKGRRAALRVHCSDAQRRRIASASMPALRRYIISNPSSELTVSGSVARVTPSSALARPATLPNGSPTTP